MTVGFYAGSFDPFTNGHLQVVKKACKIFDLVVIGIGTNPLKKRRFSKEEMKEAIEEVMRYECLDEQVEVCIFDNMSVDTAKQYNSNFLIRGIRNGIDYQYEENIASMNQEIESLDTIYFRAGELGNVSSSMVMELLRNSKDVSKYLPAPIFELVKNHLS